MKILVLRAIPFEKDWDKALQFGDFLPEEHKRQSGMHR